MLSRPSFIHASLPSAPLTFEWSNAIAVSLGHADELPLHLANAITAVNYKGQMALALASLEWVFWRVGELTDVSDPLQRVEAAWASTVDNARSGSLDFSDVRDDVARKGNPNGPLQTALIRLDTLHYAYTESETSMAMEATRCVALAHHVMSGPSGFEPWLASVLVALSTAYPRASSYALTEETFDHSGEPPIPRAWFESLAVPPDAAADRAAWDTFLRGLDPAENPYLAPVVIAP